MAASRRPDRLRSLGWLIAVLAMLMAILAVPTSASAAGAAGSGTLSLDQATYIQGSSTPLRATYYTWYSSDPSVVADVNTNWVGVFRSGDPVDSAHDQKWAYAPNLNGTAELSISSLPAGNYVAYYFYNNGWTQLAGPVSFSVSSDALSLDHYSYSKGSSLTASYSTSYGNSSNWVGVFKSGDPVDGAHDQAWAYVSSSSGSGTASVDISSLAAGKYVAYLFWNDGWTQLAGPVSFSVVPKYDHVFMIMLENSPYNGIYSDATSTPSNMPNLKSLKSQGTWFSNYHAVTHPSDENYTAIAGGDTYTTGGVYFPSFNDPNTSFANRLDAVGKDWRGYAEGNGPTGCNTSSSQNSQWDQHTTIDPTGKPWYPDDEPFVNYNYVVGTSPTSTSYCQSHVFDTQPWSTATHDLADDLSNNTVPAFSWVAADDWDNGEHSGNGNSYSRNVQDTWLGSTVSQIMSSSAWTTQNSLLIITWDEDYAYTANNNVPALVLGSSGVTAGKTSNALYDHYSTGATIEDALGIAPITNNDRGAMPLVDAFTP